MNKGWSETYRNLSESQFHNIKANDTHAMTPLPLWAASILGDLQGVRYWEVLGVANNITRIIIWPFTWSWIKGERSAGQWSTSQLTKSRRSHRPHVRARWWCLGFWWCWYCLSMIIIDCEGMHTSYFWQVCTLSTFGRYAASGGHNAILQLLLLQPGIDINTPDR